MPIKLTRRIALLLALAVLLLPGEAATQELPKQQPDSDAWVGQWELRREVVYSTCPNIAVGAGQDLQVTVTVAAGALAGTVVDPSDGSSKKFSAKSVAGRLELRNGPRLGIDLWEGPGGISGRAVSVQGRCAVVATLAPKHPATPEPDVLAAEATSPSLAKIGKVTPRHPKYELEAKAIRTRIASEYLSDLKTCHLQLIQSSPDARGKVAIRLTVGATERVERASVKSFNSELSDCIRGNVLSWRFAAPEINGQISSADFEIPIVLGLRAR